jgi:predicted metal-dependent RNase
MTDKLYTVAGTSTLNGETKARFANDTMRIKVLSKNGHTDIMLVELPTEMTKLQAAQFISGLDEFSGAAEQEAIAEYLGKHTPKTAKVVTKKAVKAAVVTKPAKTKAEVKAVVDAAEDAPF